MASSPRKRASRGGPSTPSQREAEEPYDDDEFDDDDEFPPRIGMLPAERLDAVIKLFCQHTEPNYSLPWQMRRQTSSTSTGFVLSGRRLLTNAHCVDNATVVKVKKRASSTKYIAEVLAIGRECDLALLTVDDDDFWKGITPITLAERLPTLQDNVNVVGFPVGGDNVCITQGVVSRIDMQEYVHGCCELLAVQIDAAINPGNSGGPAFGGDNHECVGIAFQSLKDGQTENIGYIIPTEVANHFLTDVARGGYTGFVELGLEMQRLENPSLRQLAGMKPKAAGLLVKLVHPTSGSHDADVRRLDVLTHIDGVAIANDGTVPFKEGGGRISFSYLLSQRYVGDTTTLTLLRNGKPLPPTKVDLKVHTLLVPEASNHRKSGMRCPDLRMPSYYVLGGLVFCALCEPYLRSEYGEEFDAKAPIKLLDRWQYGIKEAADSQVVVLSQVLAHASLVGYEHFQNHLVTRVNGVALKSLHHLVQLVADNAEPFLRFEMEPHDELVVLDASKADEVTAELLQSHQIPADRSADLQGVGKTAAKKKAEPAAKKEAAAASSSSSRKRKA